MTSPSIRERLEEIEREILSDKACLSSQSKGRERPEKQHPFRTDFQRDRDRIIHCKSFRRLKHKTQVFLAPFGDHYRTRLTHALEVSQIARTIANSCRQGRFTVCGLDVMEFNMHFLGIRTPDGTRDTTLDLAGGFIAALT